MMWIALFVFLMVVIFGKLLLWGISAAWGIFKFAMTLVFSPLILIAMVVGGLIHIALPILLIIGAVMLIKRMAKA